MELWKFCDHISFEFNRNQLNIFIYSRVNTLISIMNNWNAIEYKNLNRNSTSKKENI